MATPNYSQPDKFSFIAEEWEDWVTTFRSFRITTSLKSEDEPTQVEALCYCMGAIQAKAIMKDFKYNTIQVAKEGGGTQHFEEKAEILNLTSNDVCHFIDF